MGAVDAERYTYRLNWDEESLSYTIGCDEHPLRYRNHTDAEGLLDYSIRYMRRDIESGFGRMFRPPTRPYRPSAAGDIARRSMERAIRRASLGLDLDGRMLPDSWGLRFTPDERHLMTAYLGWDDKEFALSRDFIELDDRALIRRYCEARDALDRILTIEAMDLADRGDGLGARAVERDRREADRAFMTVEPHNRRKIIACTDAILRRWLARARSLNILRLVDVGLGLEPTESDAQWRTVLRFLFAMPCQSHGLPDMILGDQAEWMRMLLVMPHGWAVRFAPELIGDMQRIIDMGLDRFEIVQVKEKWGVLRVLFEDDPRERGGIPRRRWEELTGLMADLLDLYETLSGHTCIHCGSQYQIRAPRDGWIEPLCHACLHAQKAAHPYGERTHDAWRDMDPIPNEAVESARILKHRSPLAEKLPDAHIWTLLKRCDAEAMNGLIPAGPAPVA